MIIIAAKESYPETKDITKCLYLDRLFENLSKSLAIVVYTYDEKGYDISVVYTWNNKLIQLPLYYENKFFKKIVFRI